MWPAYNRDQFLDDVITLLREKGIEVEPAPAGPRRLNAAQEMLSSLGVTPTLSPEIALDLDGHAAYNRLVHGD